LSQNTNKTFNAIELNNVICGYTEIEYTDTIISGKNYLILHQNTFANFHALGRDISSQQKFVYHVDLVSGNFIYHKSYIHQGDTEIGGEMFFEDNQLRIVTLEGKEEIIEIPDGTILPNTQPYPYFKNDSFTLCLCKTTRCNRAATKRGRIYHKTILPGFFNSIFVVKNDKQLAPRRRRGAGGVVKEPYPVLHLVPPRREKKPERKSPMGMPMAENLIRLGVEQGQAYAWSRSRMGGWAIARSPILGTTITVDRLKLRGYVPMLELYNQIKPLNYIGAYTLSFPMT